jgi:heat shock protein HslJ
MLRVPAPHRSRAALLWVVLLPALLLAAGCGDDDSETSSDADAGTATGAPPAEIAGAFVATEVAGESLADGAGLTIVFEDGNVAAVGGCNTLTGGYVIADGVLQAGELAQTLMACEEPLERQDDWVRALLTSNPTITLDGDVLTIAGEDVTVTLERDAAEGSNALDDTAWTMVSLDGPDGTAEAPEGATLVFADDQVSISTGCNSGFAETTVGDGTLTIGPIGVTRMACEPDLAEWENAVLAFLEGDLEFTAESDDLTLTKGDQTLALTALI